MFAAEVQQRRKERGQVCKHITGYRGIELGTFAHHAFASRAKEILAIPPIAIAARAIQQLPAVMDDTTSPA
jgi:hypothetical protein